MATADEVIRALSFSPALQAGESPLSLSASGSALPLVGGATPGGSVREGVAVAPSASDDVLKVYVRVRPTPPAEEQCVQLISDTEILFKRPGGGSSSSSGVQQDTPGEKYSFTRAFGPLMANAELFAHSALPLLRDLFRQRDGLLFAYGVTSSGKTFTIQGSKDDPGVVPRALKLTFDALDEIEKRRATQSHGSLEACRLDALGVEVNMQDDFRVVLSYLEVYNENVYDLLADQVTGLHVQRAVLKTKEDQEGRIFIPGLKEIQVSSHEEALAVVHYGQQQRQVAQTRLNADSSRSHAILTVQLCRVGTPSSQTSVSRLCVVDLAGAERVARTQTGGARLKEAAKINASLLTLGRCMEVLRANAARTKGAPARVVPFRESKMTRLLHDYFVQGSGSMSMIVAVHPGVADADETVHSLRFSAIAREVHSMDLKYPASGPLSLRAQAFANKRPATAPAQQLLDEEDDEEEERERSGGAGTEAMAAQLSAMRRRLMATEARCLSLEAEIRDEVAAEMSERLAEMEAMYRQRLDGTGTEERHHEKLALYKAHSARKAERDATSSHLQLVERVKEYERALVTAEEDHAVALCKVEAQHAAHLVDAHIDEAAELSKQQRAHEEELGRVHAAHALELARLARQLPPTAAFEPAPAVANREELDAALRRADDAAIDASAARVECERLRAEAQQREKRAAAELAEKEAQLASNMCMEVESLEFQLRADALEKQRLCSRVAELEGRLHELIAVAQHNMLRGVKDGGAGAAVASAARGGAGRANEVDAGGSVRAVGRTLVVGARAAVPAKRELLQSSGRAAALRYDQVEVRVEAPSAPGLSASGSGGEGSMALYTGELRRTATKDGVGMVLVTIDGHPPGELGAAASPAKRKLNGAPATNENARGEAAGSSPVAAADASEPKRARSSGLASGERQPLLDAQQQPATSDDLEDLAAATPGSSDVERAKQIAAKVAARQQDATSKPASKFGMPSFARSKAAPPPEPTPIAGRTRTRATRK
ncbi:kinesin motor domain-containing protein [Pavlovales sp. CCMP2436]|nr:kinesin motor domain-containing protein [Pavlovales sp. CCMP2436]